MHVRWGEVVCATYDVAPQDAAMPVELEHESGGSREAAQVIPALDRELVRDAAPKIDALVLRLDLDLDFGLDWFPARLTGDVDALLGSQRRATQSRTMVVWLVSELVVTFADAAVIHATGHRSAPKQ